MKPELVVVYSIPNDAIPCAAIAKVSIISVSDDIIIKYPLQRVKATAKIIFPDITVGDLVDAYDAGNAWFIKAQLSYPFSPQYKIDDIFLEIPSECMELYD